MGLLVFPDIFDDTSCLGKDDGLIARAAASSGLWVTMIVAMELVPMYFRNRL